MEYFIYDTALLVDGRKGRGLEPMEADKDLIEFLMGRLAGIGFSIVRGSGLDQFTGEWKGLKFGGYASCKVDLTFYQDIVCTRPDGGRYEFDRRQKMPYLIGKRYELTMNVLTEALRTIGFSPRAARVESANPDPLAYFNSKWTNTRFRRDENGWPDEKELASWDRRDGDGEILHQGAIRWARDRSGYLRRGRVYGGINGMWMFVYGPGRRDHTHESARSFFTWTPETPRKQHAGRHKWQSTQLEKMRVAMRKAAADEDYATALAIKTAAERFIEKHAIAQCV